MLMRGIFLQSINLRFTGILLVGKNTSVFGLRKIHFSGRLVIGKNSTIDARFSKGISFGKNCSVGSSSIIRSSGSMNFIASKIIIGDNTSFGPFSNIGGGFGVSIGKNNIFGPYCSIHPENHIYTDQNLDIKEQGIHGVGIVVGENNWFGAKSTVLDGAKIGSNNVIGANSTITGKTYGDNSLIKGTPARQYYLKKNH